jgi:hypothetical protein
MSLCDNVESQVSEIQNVEKMLRIIEFTLPILTTTTRMGQMPTAGHVVLG